MTNTPNATCEQCGTPYFKSRSSKRCKECLSKTSSAMWTYLKAMQNGYRKEEEEEGYKSTEHYKKRVYRWKKTKKELGKLHNREIWVEYLRIKADEMFGNEEFIDYYSNRREYSYQRDINRLGKGAGRPVESKREYPDLRNINIDDWV